MYDISEKIHHDSLRLETLRRMLPAYYGTSNHEEVQRNAPLLKQLFDQVGATYLGPMPDVDRRRGMINAFNAVGLSFQQLGAYDSAIHYYNIAMNIARHTGDEEWVGILSGNEAIVFTRQGRYKACFERAAYRHSCEPHAPYLGIGTERMYKPVGFVPAAA
ncbi:MAG: tetratricopeptide repeat protein [Bacteroidia bacterium]|nr:tetratricopeptide repeat protein [Bacteroidia bacterium]